jgi:hypothetical protein
MTDEQENDWAYKMVSCLGLSTANSDINVIKLHMNIKKLYEQGRLDEREACAKLCELQWKQQALRHYASLTYSQSANDCATAIRARGEK